MNEATPRDSSKNVAVVGAGLGGIASALRFLHKGYNVTLFDSLDAPGGRASVFRRDGHIFDAGPTVITAPYLIDELFSLFGKKREDHVEFVPVDPFYRVHFPGGDVFDYVGEEDRILEQIRKFSPDDVDGYKRLAEHSQKIFDKGYTELADAPFEGLADMFRVAPDMIRLENYRTVYGLVSKYIKDPRLRQVFTFQPLLVGGSPFRTSSIYLLIHWLERKWGVWFAKGGTGAIVEALIDLFVSHGGRLRMGTPVEQVDIDNKSVTGVKPQGGRFERFDTVVCNADPTMVYRHLIDDKARPKYSDGRLGRVQQSMGLFVTYFGTNRRFDDVAHHTIVLGPRYKGLLNDIFKKRILADDFSLYLHRPTATDGSLAPEGCETFYVLSPVPNLKANIDWETTQQRYQDAIIDHLEERLMPGLRESLTCAFSVDPRYFANTLKSADGAAFGPEPLLRQSAGFRYQNRAPGIDGLYFVGAGTHPGAGVPGVLSSARVVDRFVERVAEVPHEHRQPVRGAA